MITILEAVIIAILTIVGVALYKTIKETRRNSIRLKLIVPIDEWDKYCAEWDISEFEVEEIKVNGKFVLQTYEEMADALVNNKIAVPF
jgi:hypothetical protein